jgi:hypothetical protein
MSEAFFFPAALSEAFRFPAGISAVLGSLVSIKTPYRYNERSSRKTPVIVARRAIKRNLPHHWS